MCESLLKWGRENEGDKKDVVLAFNGFTISFRVHFFFLLLLIKCVPKTGNEWKSIFYKYFKSL